MKQEDYVSYEVAKMLKEEGYDEKCSSLYLSNATFIEDMYECKDFEKKIEDGFCDAPSLSEAAKWLRENYRMAVIPIPYRFVWNYNIYDLKEINEEDWTHKILGSRVNWETYEEALNEGILEALKKIRKEK